MPATLSPLFCSPQDVYELIGIESAQLRLDDQNQASGQKVQTIAAASINDVALSIAALQYPLLRGTNLVFSDAGMDSPVEVTLNAVASVGAITLTVVPLTTAIPATAIAIDNGVNVWLAGLLVKACNYATGRILTYCGNRYEASQLATDFTVNQWATTIAAHWLATRLFRGAPQQIKESYDETMLELKDVQASRLNLQVATRTSGLPWLSNVTVDPTYVIRKVRVESQISENTPTQYYQSVDWSSVLLFEW